jgi:Sep-tRNA:Cys-tRNA synthetase
VTAEAVAEKIEKVKAETGALPRLMMIDHFDYQFGNEHEVRGIGKVAKDYGIPFLYNGAYTVGVMPVDGKEIGADFVVGSGHKSMAAVAPSGVLATTEEWAERVFRTTEMTGDVTGKRFGIKEVENMGCTLMGGTLISMIASFPRVKARTAAWEEEVAKSNRFLRELSRIEGTRVLSELPRRHTLSKVDTTESFDRVAKTHKRRGYFLSDELKERGIIGEFAGATRVWKLNTYGLTSDQVDYTAGSFLEIAEGYGLKIS